MNRFTMAFALAVLAIGSPACAQKSSAPAMTASKAQATARDSKTEKLAVKSETKEEAEATAEEKVAAKPTKSSGRGSLTVEQEKKIKSLTKQTVKGFSKAELTEEQQMQADELFTKAARDYVLKRSKAEITDDLEKKRVAGLKEARASGKSVKEQADAAFMIAGYSEDQIKVHKSTQASLVKAKREFGRLLTEEQVAKLPKQLQGLIAGK